MSLIKSKQLNLPLGTVQAMDNAFVLPAGKNVTVTTKFASKNPIGVDGTGVPTSSPHNYVSLRSYETGKDITAKDGTQIYGRLTEAAGVWTIGFYKSDGAGGEAEHTFSDESEVTKGVTIRFGEVKQVKDINPLNIVMGLDQVDESDVDPNAHRPFTEQVNVVDNQTAISLGYEPKFPGSVDLMINGVSYPAAITVSTTNLTFDPSVAGFALESDDEVYVSYDR